MKAIFGVVSLLIVLAIGGVVMTKQLKAVGQVPVAAAGDAVVPGGGVASGNAREQSQQLQQKVRDDVAKALEQGAQSNAARGEEATR